jgi:hypothetical protein
MKAASLVLSALVLGMVSPSAAWPQTSAAPVRIAPPPVAGTPPVFDAPSAPGAAVYGPPTVTPELCRRLAPRQPAVPSATYQPGVDVYGRPVAPADLPGAAATPSITTEIDLGRVAGRAAARGIKGYVTVQPDGSVLLDGQPLSGGQEYGLLDICRAEHLIP